MSIPLSRTINILDRIYNQKLLKANIKKHTLKKLLRHCCTRNVFTFNNVIYEQIDGVSMWSCLGPTIANFIMTELEAKVVDSLFKDGLQKFWICYLHDTVVLIDTVVSIKKSDIVNVVSKLKA